MVFNVFTEEMWAEILNLLHDFATMEDALRSIVKLDAGKDSDEGYNEWGEADCFHIAQCKAGDVIHRLCITVDEAHVLALEEYWATSLLNRRG